MADSLQFSAAFIHWLAADHPRLASVVICVHLFSYLWFHCRTKLVIAEVRTSVPVAGARFSGHSVEKKNAPPAPRTLHGSSMATDS